MFNRTFISKKNIFPRRERTKSETIIEKRDANFIVVYQRASTGGDHVFFTPLTYKKHEYELTLKTFKHIKQNYRCAETTKPYM